MQDFEIAWYLEASRIEIEAFYKCKKCLISNKDSICNSLDVVVQKSSEIANYGTL